MIQKENKKNRKMFIVADLVSLSYTYFSTKPSWGEHVSSD